MKTFTAKERKAMVGKRVSWEVTLDRHRGYFRAYSGTILEFKGNNVNVDGVWQWFPDMNNFKIEETDNAK